MRDEQGGREVVLVDDEFVFIPRNAADESVRLAKRTSHVGWADLSF